MKTLWKFSAYLLATASLAACGGGSSLLSSGDSDNPGGSATATSNMVNIGNISTIPLGGTNSNIPLAVTNNLNDVLQLQSGSYSLVAADVSTAPEALNGSNSPVDASQCASIAGHSQCNLMVKVPQNVSQGQYLITLNYLDSQSGKTYTAKQIVSYSGDIPAVPGGVKVSIMNNTVYNQPNNVTAMSIPFVLTKDFSSLSVSSNNRNPAIMPNIICPDNSFKAGALCSVSIKIANTSNVAQINGGITVSGISAQTTSLSTNSTNLAASPALKSAASYVFGTPITINQNSVGNLITSAQNVKITLADGAHPKTVSLYNNGNQDLSNMQYNAGTPLSMLPGNCGSTLSNGSSCSFTVNANSTTSGEAPVSISYTYSTTPSTSYQVVNFNVIYTSATPGPALTLTTTSSLSNTIVGSTQYAYILVKNASTNNTSLSNITFNTPPASAGLSWDSSSSCALNGTQSLSVNSECTLVLKYVPSATTSGTPSFTLKETALWTDPNGKSQSYNSTSISIPYTAITGSAFIYFTPDYVSYSIRSEGHDLESQTFTLTNAGQLSTTLESLNIASPSVTNYTKTGGTCSNGTVLTAANTAGESCTLSVQFGPTTTVMTNTFSQMLVNYQAQPGASDSLAFANLNFTSANAAYITMAVATPTNITGGNGTSSLNAYQFTNSPAANTQITFTVTYTNSGTANANKFNVALNNLPMGYMVDSTNTNCGYESTDTYTLPTGSNCKAVFKAVDPNSQYNPYGVSGDLSFYAPGYSYTDTNTGLNTKPYYTNSYIYVNANTFATITTASPTWTTGTAGAANSFLFTGVSAPTDTQITIPNTELTVFTLGTSGKCTILSPNGNCSISITNPAGYPLNTPTYFNYWVTPSNLTPSASNSMILTGSFTYSS